MNLVLAPRSVLAVASTTTLVIGLISNLGTPVEASGPEVRPDVVRSATSSLKQAVGPELWAEPGLSQRSGVLPCDHTPVGPPPSPGLGDSWNWYIWALNGFPTATLQSCTVRGMSEHAYVVVEDSQWNVNIDQSKVDLILSHFEDQSIGQFPDQGIWDLNTTWFGDPPDAIDQDGRVYILYYDFDVNSDGFFWAFDQECDDTAQFHSNECDVVYMNSSDFDPAGSYLLAVVAHELEHLIHYNYDPNEFSWIDEGLGELAMWLYGDPDNISAFPTNSDRDLTNFGGNWYDYIKSYMWTLYFAEHYGGQPTIRALVAETANSTVGHDAVLAALGYSERFADIFQDWVVANYLDDTTIADGRYGYFGETIPPFTPFATWSTYPVGPNNASVSHWAGEYVRYLDGSSLEVTFDGTDTGNFAARAILLDDVNPTEVVDVSLDGTTEAGSLVLPQVGSTHDELVMVHAKINGSGGTGYTYAAQVDATDVSETEMAATELRLRTRFDGDELTVSFDTPPEFNGSPYSIELFDVRGRQVARVGNGTADSGIISLAAPVKSLAPGRYFVRLSLAGKQVTAAVTRLR